MTPQIPETDEALMALYQKLRDLGAKKEWADGEIGKAICALSHLPATRLRKLDELLGKSCCWLPWFQLLDNFLIEVESREEFDTSHYLRALHNRICGTISSLQAALSTYLLRYKPELKSSMDQLLRPEALIPPPPISS